MNTQNQSPLWTNSHKATLAGLLLLQFAVAYFIGAGHWLTNDAGSAFPPIAVTVALPVIAFFAAYALSTRFRTFVLAQDIKAMTRLQYWRVIGFVFLPLYAFGVLPGLFAWPAGLGDVAVGLFAAVIVARIERDPDYVTSAGFMRFHLLGLLDFVVAITTSALAGGVFPQLISNGLTSGALDVWPLNIFPSFIVPGFIILQVSTLLKVREIRRVARGELGRLQQTA